VIVIDASAIASMILEENEFDNLSEFLKIEPISIDLLIKEATSAILKAYKRKRINENDLNFKYEALNNLKKLIKFYSQDEILPDAFQLSKNENISIYDALYISLAKLKKASILSIDKKLRETANKLNIKTFP